MEFMSVRLCVLLWPFEGRDTELHRYEDSVLPLLDEHDGRLIARETVERANSDDPLEVHVIEFADQAALDGYMTDPRRLALEERRLNAVERTQILRLE